MSDEVPEVKVNAGMRVGGGSTLPLGGLPALDSLFGMDRKFGEFFAASVDAARAGAAYQAGMAQRAGGLYVEFWLAWLNAPTSEPAGTNTAPRAASATQRTEHALQRVNDAMLKMQHTPDFLELQRRALSTASRYRQTQQALTDAFSTYTPFATTGEFDDLSRSVQELKRELRALRREAAATAAASERAGAGATAAVGGIDASVVASGPALPVADVSAPLTASRPNGAAMGTTRTAAPSTQPDTRLNTKKVA